MAISTVHRCLMTAGPAPTPIDMLPPPPPIQQAFSFEDSGFCA